jgi:hypothetical protein
VIVSVRLAGLRGDPRPREALELWERWAQIYLAAPRIRCKQGRYAATPKVLPTWRVSNYCKSFAQPQQSENNISDRLLSVCSIDLRVSERIVGGPQLEDPRGLQVCERIYMASSTSPFANYQRNA